MTSQEQFEANRVNAAKSTGPKTEAGKSRSKMNALRHGLTAASVVIRGEDPREFERLHAEFVEEFAPRSPFAAELAGHAATSAWRLRRGARFEAAVFASREADVVAPHGDAELSSIELGDALIRDATDGDALGKVARHEASLTRNLERTLTMLRELREEAAGPVEVEAADTIAA